MVGGELKETNRKGEVRFAINPDQVLQYLVIKDGYETQTGQVSLDAKFIKVKLQPIKKEISSFRLIKVLNKQGYQGNILIKGPRNKYLYEIDEKEGEYTFGILDDEVEVSLSPEITHNEKYQLLQINTSIYKIEATLQDEERTPPPDITKPKKVIPLPESQPVKNDIVSKTIKPQKAARNKTSSKMKVQPGKPISYVIKDNPEFEDTMGKQEGNTFTLNLNKRKGAIALVLVLNTREALEKQGVLEEKAKRTFKYKKKYRRILLGYVDYINGEFTLKELGKKRETGEIKLKATVINDPVEVMIKKIVSRVKQIFSAVNMSSRGKKLKQDKLWIVLNTNILPLNEKEFKNSIRLPVLNVEFIDLKEVIDTTVLDKIVKEKEAKHGKE
jgi:hypothetical protein